MRRPIRPARPPLPREALAAAMTRVAEDYAVFVAAAPRGEELTDPKAFAARQAAARAALAHIAELAELAAGAAEEEPAASPQAGALIDEARAGLAEEGET